ncbi:MAG: ABC transporter permease [candidate division WWE3 bacterium]|nr:ABC transporter permease [candidate division WWE3 bacterium]
MDLLEILKVSLKAIAHNKVRAALTMLGIIIGVASVILLVSIGSGLQGYITGQLDTLGSNLVTVLPGKVSFSSGGAPAFAASKLNQQALDLITRSPAVAEVMGVHFSPGVLKYRNQKIYVSQIQGVSAKLLSIASNHKISQGRFFSSGQASIGSRVVVIGDQARIDLFGNNVSPLDHDITIEGRTYKVIGVFERQGGTGFGGNSDSIAMIPDEAFQKQFGFTNYAEIMLQAKPEYGAQRAAEDIKRVLGRRLDSENDFSIFTQEQLLTSVNSILGAVTAALGGIAAISLVVGGIGIMNIMLVSVTERTREIGLRKAVGAKPAAILLQFMLEAIILSLFGGLIGILLGAGGSAIINNFIKTSVSLGSIALAAGVSAAIGIVFGTAPAISAARKDPIVALRYE